MVVQKQSAWGLWWICFFTFGIYYCIWYHRINKELSAITGEERGATAQWWSQLIPIFSLVALAQTAGRLNRAHAALGSPTRVSSVVTWLWAPIWYASQTRYLQRRLNILHDVQAGRMAQVPTPAAPAVPGV